MRQADSTANHTPPPGFFIYAFGGVLMQAGASPFGDWISRFEHLRGGKR
jgi:hypothetical protein